MDITTEMNPNCSVIKLIHLTLITLWQQMDHQDINTDTLFLMIVHQFIPPRFLNLQSQAQVQIIII